MHRLHREFGEERPEPIPFLSKPKGGIRRLLHPVPHGGSGITTGGAHKFIKVKLPLSSWNERHLLKTLPH